MADRVVRVVLRGAVDGFVSGMRSAQRAVRDTTRDLTAADARAQEFRSGLDAVGKTAGAIGLAAGAGLGVAIAAAANFDEAMSKVQAATHETAANMDLLREAALKAGADTSFSASEAAEGVEALAKAGVSTKDILGGGLRGALDLAASDGIAVGDAAEFAASALTQFNLAGSDTVHVADLLAAGAGKAQGGVGDLGQALNQSGLVAAQTGLSIEETVGALAEFAHAGLIGSDAGTSFKTMLQALNPNSKEAADAMEDLGISAYDAQGNFVGMTAFAANLQNGLKDLSVEQQNATLKTIFGADAVRAASIIFKDGAKGVAEWQTNVNDAGYAADTAALRLDNLKGDLEALKGSFENALIGLGEGSQGPLRKVVQGATDAVNAFGGLPPAVQGSVTALLGITAITGGAIFLGTAVIGRIAATRVALDSLGVSAVRARAALSSIAVGGGVLAGLAAVGFALHQLEKDDATPSLRKYSEAFGDLGKSSATTAADIDKLFQASGSNAAVIFGAKASIDGVRDAFEKLNASDFTKFGLFASSGFGTFDTEADLATKSVAKADEALTKMVSSGNIEEAQKSYALLAKEAKAAGLSQDKLADLFPKYNESLPETTEKTEVLADGTKVMGDASEIAARKIELTDEALKKVRETATGTAQEFFGLGASVDDSKVSLDEWIANLGKQEEALRDFTKNSQRASRRGVDDGLISSLQAAGPAGALRLKELADATQKEIRRANKAWRSGQDAIDDYVDAVASVPDAKVDVDTRQARKAIRDIIAQARQIPRTIRTDYIVNQINRANKQSQYGGIDGNIDTPYWDGGYTGAGGKYQPAGVVHAGEIVWSQADIAAWGGPRAVDMMRQSRGLPEFADGGGPGSTGSRGGYGSVKSELHDYRIALRASTNAITAETRKRDDLVSQRDDLVSTIKSAFTRDLFGDRSEGFAWKSDADRRQELVGDPLDILRQDIAAGTAFKTQLAALSKKGLDGAAYAALAGTGDLEQVQAFASMTAAQLAEYERLFNQRAQVATAAGNYAGSAAFGADIKSMNAHLKRLNDRGDRLEKIEARLERLAQKNPEATGAAVGRAIRGAAPKRPKRGN